MGTVTGSAQTVQSVQIEEIRIDDDRLEAWYCASAETPARGNVVMVHGICHAAWCWERFLKFFAAHGYNCIAVSLRGHGASRTEGRLRDKGFKAYAYDARKAVEYITRTGCDAHEPKPIIIGHSMGGAVVQRYLWEYAGTVSAAVLLAPATACRMGVFSYFHGVATNRSLGLCQKANMKGMGSVTDEEIACSAFFNNVTGDDSEQDPYARVTQDEARKYHSLLKQEYVPTQLRCMTPYMLHYRRGYCVDTPVITVGSQGDAYFPEWSLARTQERYHRYSERFGGMQQAEAPLLVDDPATCHDIMLDMAWEQAAEKVLGWIEGNAAH